ncbi:MAG TPA: ABC transporter ATP-binding protein [Aggregatilineaceae bacterium]|nr:ABC transporter ATP-binding protein [Aggregatilineaceae bacterium]
MNVSSHQVVLRTENLTKRFGDVEAVRGLTLEVYEGEVFGFLGPNGAGKTTSINMMCGLLKPDAGQVTIHGQLVRGGEAAVIRRVGVCPQNITLWSSLTCLEQMTFMGEMYNVPTKIARQRSQTLLEQMGLSEKMNKQAGTLSGGMQRRLNLIMALVHDPDILVLDEPEAGLDPQSRVLMREYIQSLARQKTVILTTHNMDEAERLADRVAIIDHGQLLQLDTPDHLKRQIGEGDVLEIGLDTDDQVKQACEQVSHIIPTVSIADHTLVIRARNVVEQLPAILDSLKSNGLNLSDVRLRASTLEDVFIALTGRRLRE